MKHQVKALIEKDEEKGGYVAVASTDVEDRQGERVMVEGWDLKAFKQNPVLLLFHDHHSLPVGKAEKIWVEKGSKSKLMFKPIFEDVTERGRAIKELVKQGFLKTFSVGFRPIDSDGNTFTKQELLEISLVNVPANPEAMMLAFKSLEDVGIKEKTIKEVIGDDKLEVELLKEEIKSIREIAEKARADSELAVKGLKHLNPHDGREQRIALEQRKMSKVIDRATSLMLNNKHNSSESEKLLRTVKRANELLILSQKGN